MLLTGFALLLPGVVTLLLVLLLSAILWYYYSIHVPYAKFPSYRLDTQVLYWILKKKHVNSLALRKMIDVCKKYETEGMCVIWVGQPILFIYSEEAVRTFINEPAAIDKPNLYKLAEFVLGQTIFTSNGEKWKKKRKTVAPAFQLVPLKDKIPIINENAEALVQQLSIVDNNITDETINFIKSCSLRIFLESSLGVKGCKNADEELTFKCFAEAIEANCDLISHRLLEPWLYFDIALHLFPFPRKCLRLYKKAYDAAKKIVEDIKDSATTKLLPLRAGSDSSETFSDYGRRPRLFSEILVEEHLKDPSFTIKELQDEINLICMAGYDTVAHTLEWCLFLLGLHQDIQEKTYQEVLSETEGSIHYDNLRNLDYMGNVIKETLRLYPVGPFILRRLSKDMQCGKYKVSKNTSVGIFILLLHRNPEIYPNPDAFDPDRFTAANSRIRQWNYIPFAEGIRNCPGKAFAMIEMKIILAHVLRNFKIISLDSREDVGMSWETFVKPKKHPRIQFFARHPVSSVLTY